MAIVKDLIVLGESRFMVDPSKIFIVEYGQTPNVQAISNAKTAGKIIVCKKNDKYYWPEYVYIDDDGGTLTLSASWSKFDYEGAGSEDVGYEISNWYTAQQNYYDDFMRIVDYPIATNSQIDALFQEAGPSPSSS